MVGVSGARRELNPMVLHEGTLEPHGAQLAGRPPPLRPHPPTAAYLHSTKWTGNKYERVSTVFVSNSINLICHSWMDRLLSIVVYTRAADSPLARDKVDVCATVLWRDKQDVRLMMKYHVCPRVKRNLSGAANLCFLHKDIIPWPF